MEHGHAYRNYDGQRRYVFFLVFMMVVELTKSMSINFRFIVLSVSSKPHSSMCITSLQLVIYLDTIIWTLAKSLESFADKIGDVIL